MASAVYSEIKKAGALPSSTGVVLEILRLAQGEHTTLSRIAAIIEKDPAIASRLLRFVNSPFVGMPKKIGSISQAVTLLGFQTVKAISLGFSLVSMNKDGPCKKFDYQGFWSESVAIATVARRIARTLKNIPADEAFTSGLLCQIGRLAFATAFPEAYSYAIELAQPQGSPTLIAIERELFDIDHNELAAEMMADWRLPEYLVEAVRFQDSQKNSNLDPESLQAALIGTLQLARSIAMIFRQSTMPQQFLLSTNKSARNLGIRPDVFPTIFDGSANDWCQAGAVFDVPTHKVLTWGEVYAVSR